MILYTLEEAAQIALWNNHLQWGHDWDVIKSGDGQTIMMTCECGATAKVTPPTLPQGREIDG